METLSMNKTLTYLLYLSLALTIALPACQKKAPGELSRTPAQGKGSANNTLPSLSNQTTLGAENIFIRVSREVMPAVVNIQVFQKVTAGEGMYGHGQMPDDQYHNPGGNGKPHTEQTMGSGVIISADGYIITNAHVVNDSTDMKVTLSDKREFPAKLIGADTKTDVAVVKVDAKGPLPTALLGDSSKLEIGQWAIAIGNPFGLDRTVTVGVVSGMGRADVGVAQYENFIQTDASINPGNSGGPLINSRGEVIGINTVIMSVGQGIGFAIPINMAKEVSKSLIEKGKVVRGWLGIGIQTLTPELAGGMRLKVKSGVLVNKLYKGSPAMKAGFKVGDVVIAFDGRPVSESRELQSIVADTKVGKAVDVKVIRDGSGKTLRVRIDEMADFENKETGEQKQAEASEMLGLTVRPFNSQMEGAESKGVVVVAVEGGSGAEKAGLTPGDVITAIGRDKVEGLADFKKAAGKARKGDTAVVLVIRAGNPLFIAFKDE